MCEGDVRTVFVRSGFTSKGFCLSLDDYVRELNVDTVSSIQAVGSVSKGVHASLDF